MKILIATGNPHKFKELVHILPAKLKNGTPIEYVSLADFKGLTLPPETGNTLEDNAEIKAVYAARESGMPALSDDTGLEVKFLHGAPGVHTARYAGEHADADDNNRKLLSALEGQLLPARAASFRTVACLATPQGRVQLFDGTLEGFIGFGYKGENGFGYDPIFLVGNSQKTLAELTEREKNQISHRAKAFKKLADHLVLLKNKK